MTRLRPLRRVARLAGEMDPRVKIALTLVVGVCLLKSGLPGLAVFLPVLFLLSFAASGAWTLGASSGGLGVMRAYVAFVLFWVVVKGVLDALGGMDAPEVFVQSMTLGLRLFCLLLMGLCLALTTSARRLGRAVTWFLRPVAGDRAWKVGLALALMIHYLPLAMLTASRVREGFRSRGVALSWWDRGRCTAKAVLRKLGVGAWNQALAVVSRGLDSPGAWAGPFPPCLKSLVAGTLMASGCVGLAIL